MSSLKQLSRSGPRKQTYTPILNNPFTQEAHLWPHIENHRLVAEVVKSHVTAPLALARDLRQQAPFDALCGFNSIVQHLENPPLPTSPVFLFVCNKDVNSEILLAQIPILARVSRCQVTLVALPRGFVANFDACDPHHDGFLLVIDNDKFDRQIAAKLRQNVPEPTILPWLQYEPAKISLVASTTPVRSKGKPVPKSR
ncbi:LAMI_0B06216g1_1 [Lachancea mirantina]|uniref:LAMI_0B06216g1_1 n=1 Tax=Lachancea mirantina TaxID=1230905 RepID=A0A1G4IWG1_9SACH|nr:LAMI_0B06216g1_1 [Lachancea mirantina]